MAAVERNNYQAPHVEEYDSDASAAGQVVTESFSRKSSPMAQANVSTKRSKDLKKDKAPAAEQMPTNIDLRSDSGYSSFTAASKSSADSAPSATSRSPPVVPTNTAHNSNNNTTAPPVSQSPAPKTRRPTVGEQRQHSNESSPRQKPSRTASVSSKQRPAGLRRPTLTQGMRGDNNRDEECRDPTCTTCGPNAPPPQRRRPDLPPSASTHSVPTYQSDQMSQHSAPDPYYSPPSPTYIRQAPPYAAQGAVVQTARTRRSSSVSRPRPQSFAGDASAGYWGSIAASAYPSPPHEHGPPPSFSAYQNRHMPNMPNMPYGTQAMPPFMGGPPPGNYYGHPGPQYDAQQRPPPSARTASNYNQRAPPIITQEDPERSKYSARYNHSQPPTPSEHHTRNPSLQPRKQLQLAYTGPGQEEASESDYSDSEEEPDEREVSRRAREAREMMPPPRIKRDKSQRRPPLTHAKTSQVVDRFESDRREQRRQSLVIPERSVRPERERERIRPAAATAPARRASVSRPPPPHRQTQSEYTTATRQARVVVNDSRHNRRQSAYQSYEKAYNDYVKAQAVDDQYNAERKREKRASRVVQEPRYVPGQFNDTDDDEEEEEEEPVRVRALSRPRRKTESDSRKGKERTAEIRQKADKAEEYIMSTRGSRDPFADQINKAALKRVSRVSQPSDSGSSNSNGSGNRTAMTSNTNNEIRLRVDGTMPLSLQLSGDMEGRTLQLVPAGDGMTDLVIGGGNSRSGGSVYRSESSVSGNKAANRRSIVAGQGRRDAEDIPDRASRGPRSRRDRDEVREVRDERGHVLRRSRTTTAYH